MDPAPGGRRSTDGRPVRIHHRAKAWLVARSPVRWRPVAKAGRRPSDWRRHWLERIAVVVALLALGFWSGLFVAHVVTTPGPCPGGQVVRVGGVKFCTHGPDKPGGSLFAELNGQANTGVVYCYGDGLSGPRVETIYAHAAGTPDNYGGLLSSLRAYAAAIDSIFNVSAQETGGIRHVRFAVDPGTCNLTVHDVQLSASGLDSLSNTITELQAQGYKNPDRKYLIWTESKVYCGIATVDNDDQPGPQNANNAGPSYARADKACWGGRTESHELMHNLGGVQLSAAHSTGRFHCNDSSEVMCYNDGGPTATQTFPCPSSHASIFDCNHEDYFSTSPAGYLVNHWNTASSAYLEQQAGSTTPPGQPPPPPPPPPPTTTTTRPPATTTTRPAPTTTRPVPTTGSTTTTTAPPSTTTTSRCLRLILHACLPLLAKPHHHRSAWRWVWPPLGAAAIMVVMMGGWLILDRRDP